jgi:hypothetical protein
MRAIGGNVHAALQNTRDRALAAVPNPGNNPFHKFAVLWIYTANA